MNDINSLRNLQNRKLRKLERTKEKEASSVSQMIDTFESRVSSRKFFKKLYKSVKTSIKQSNSTVEMKNLCCTLVLFAEDFVRLSVMFEKTELTYIVTDTTLFDVSEEVANDILQQCYKILQAVLTEKKLNAKLPRNYNEDILTYIYGRAHKYTYDLYFEIG